MEVDNLNDPSSTPAEDRRKSGRTTRRPDTFSQSTHSILEEAAGGKRKRSDADGSEGEDNDESDSDSDDTSDDEADEEELRAKKLAARKPAQRKSTARKGPRASKKPKVAGNGVRKQLAFRPALNGRLPNSRWLNKSKVRPSLAAGEHGIFGESCCPGASMPDLIWGI